MLKINKELSTKIIELEVLRSHIALIADYKKEEEYFNLHESINNSIQAINSEFTPKDISKIVYIIDESIEYFLYSSDSIIEVLFPGGTKKNGLIQSAYNWIDEKNRINWIINNVLCDNKFYEVINNVNDNYIISTKELRWVDAVKEVTR